MNVLECEESNPRHARAAASTLAIALLALSVPLAVLIASPTAAAELDDVQVAITTTQSLPYQYSLTVYNTSGSQVANFDGSYPEASFGLPSGTYLITASAYYQGYGCYMCPLGGVTTATTAAMYTPPSTEYGYAVVKVTGPVQVSIATKNDTDLPLVSLPVHVSFYNGTAASGASVYAYVVGMGYAYSPEMLSYGQTGANGNFTLAMPDAPVQVSAYLSLRVQLPQNATTVIPIEVGGQKVNVTVAWQPNNVGLYGQALILPPQSGANITLQIQQNPYPIYYSTPGQGGIMTVTTATAFTSTASGSAGQTSGQPSKISPFEPSSAQLSSGNPLTSAPFPYAIVVLVAAGVGAIAVAFAALGRKKLTASGARP